MPFIPTKLDIFSVDGAGLFVENYIYMYHLQEFIVLPSFIDSVQENFHISWQQTTPLGRSAPIYSFQNAGPRTLQMTFTLHRDMMYQINKDVSNAQLAVGDDYVDTLLKDLQACVLPDYDGTSKAVNPPIVAMRVGEDLFIKGVITGNLGYTWTYPILENGKYSNLTISFEISEIDPYSARLVRQVGSYRNISTTLDYSNIYDVNESPEVSTQEAQPTAAVDENALIQYLRSILKISIQEARGLANELMQMDADSFIAYFRSLGMNIQEAGGIWDTWSSMVGIQSQPTTSGKNTTSYKPGSSTTSPTTMHGVSGTGQRSTVNTNEVV